MTCPLWLLRVVVVGVGCDGGWVGVVDKWICGDDVGCDDDVDVTFA